LFRGQTRKEGELFGDGTIDLEDVTRPKLNLSLKAYQLYLDYFVENTNFVVSTEDLRVRGKDTISVEGDITVDQGTYIVDIDNLRKNIYLVSSKPAKDRPITWNLNLSMPGNFNISSSKLDLLNNFSLEIMGNLRSIQEANAPATDLTGHLEIMSGKYGSWGQNFTVGTGSIDFTDPKVINPDINIRAEKKAGDYYVELTLTGNLEEIKQEIQIKDENGNYLTNLTDEEILSLVSLGRIDFNVAGAGENVISTSVETAIERGAEVLTGLDNVEVASNDGGKILEFQSISLGKYLTSNLYVEYTGMFGSSYVPSPNLSWQSGNQIGIEYRINKNWSVDSRFMRTQRGNNIYKVALGWKTSF
jgi:autotransporter translocation and assembly factor TamB